MITNNIIKELEINKEKQALGFTKKGNERKVIVMDYLRKTFRVREFRYLDFGLPVKCYQFDSSSRGRAILFFEQAIKDLKDEGYEAKELKGEANKI